MIREATQALQSKQTVNPKTTLGFYATIAVSIATLSVVAAVALASADAQTWLIPWILAVGVGQALLVAGGVFYINVVNPQNLMLGQITGTEYAEIKRVTVLGDSSSGERTVAINQRDSLIELSAGDDRNEKNEIEARPVQATRSDSRNSRTEISPNDG